MKLSLDIKTSLSQTLTPQQIQYLKLLQLPLVQLEQHIMQEIEQNPMLDEASNEDDHEDFPQEPPEWEPEALSEDVAEHDVVEDRSLDYERIKQEEFSDDFDPFEFYKQIIQDDSDMSSQTRSAWDEDEGEGFQIKAGTTLIEDLTAQLRLLKLTPEEFLLGTQIIGNIDADGYLRRDLDDIVDETNSAIAEINFDAQRRRYEEKMKSEAKAAKNYNPARQFALSSSSSEMLAKLRSEYGGNGYANGRALGAGRNGSANHTPEILNPVAPEQAEKVLGMIQSLDPPGVGSRDIRECLLAQLKMVSYPTPQQRLAKEIIENHYEPFAKKHFNVITRQLSITDDELREAMDVVRRLNPKPGGGDTQAEHNTVIPDFIIERDEESGELMVGVNDSRLPALKLSKTYEKLKRDAKNKNFNKETRNWLRNKHEDAKFLIQAIRQRKSTMLKVMTAIAGLQKDFFIEGKSALKPLIYKDIAEATGLDISTVCRIVNGKYVQTDYGTFELKYFFSESLPNDDGEEVSTTVIKQIIKEMIEEEPKNKPLSDDRISEDLKARGYNVARRTVAKYREQMKIPVARLRREI